MTRQIRIDLITHFTAARRRSLLAAAASSLTGCTLRPVPASLGADATPHEEAAVFQALLPGQPHVPLAAPDSRWQVAAEGTASVEVTADGLWLASRPHMRAWASPRLPVAPLSPRASARSSAASGETRPRVEDLTWEAAITLEQRFLIVCELRFAGEPGALLIQATPFDVQIFQDPERPGGGTSQSLSLLVGDGRSRYWRLRLDDTRTELRLDGSPVWSLDGARSLARVAFGETRTDALHGGTMLLRDVVYVRRS